jgi:hypothetical protein
MPANAPAPPGQLIPGVAAPTAGYPQYGAGGGSPGSSAGWKVVTANSDAQKMQFASQGILVWFSKKADAQAFIAAQSNSLSSPDPAGLGGIADIGDFFHRLTEKSTWTRVGEVALGGILLYAGVRALANGSAVAGSGARKSAVKPAKKVVKKAAGVAAPELRLATRVASKKVAPKTTGRVVAHRATVAKYGGKTPYKPPPKRAPTVRVSHVYHHSTGKPKPKPRVTKP